MKTTTFFAHSGTHFVPTAQNWARKEQNNRKHQGPNAWQRSSNVVHSGQHPFPLKLKGRGSFSLLLSFGEAKESKER